jgi:hypothetical protein
MGAVFRFLEKISAMTYDPQVLRAERFLGWRSATPSLSDKNCRFDGVELEQIEEYERENAR